MSLEKISRRVVSSKIRNNLNDGKKKVKVVVVRRVKPFDLVNCGKEG